MTAIENKVLSINAGRTGPYAYFHKRIKAISQAIKKSARKDLKVRLTLPEMHRKLTLQILLF